MAETIPGGAYLRIAPDGTKQWVDAKGESLSKEAQADAQRIHAENDRAKDAMERDRLALEAQRNPTAQAIAAAMAPKPAPKAADKAGA